MDGKGATVLPPGATVLSPEINRGYNAPCGIGGTPDQGLMLSPVINVLENFVQHCKAQRSAYREKLEKEISEEIFLQKENLTRTFGHILNTDTIDKVCNVMCEHHKRRGVSCHRSCNELVTNVLKIVLGAKPQKDVCVGPTGNCVFPSFSDTVIMTRNDDLSEGHIGSNVASIGDISKTPVEDLNVRGTTQGHTGANSKIPICVDAPHVNHHLAKSLLSSESIPEPVHMFNKRLRHAARVNMELAPGTRLFPMNGMVHLPTSDGQRADKSYAPPDHCFHVAVDGAVETSNKLKGITPSITSKVPFDITGTGSYKHDITSGREDALRPLCNQEPKRGSAGVIMSDAINTSWATDELCAQISIVPKPRQSNVFVTSKNAILQDPDYGNATTSKNQKTAATDFTSKVGRNADHIAIHGHGPSFPCSQVKKSSSRSQQAAMVDNLYNQMNLQPEEAENIKLGDQLHIQNTSNVDAASIQNGIGVTYVGENWLEVQHPPVRIPLTIVHLRYFYILCGLGKSKWKDYVAVRLSEATTVTWESFAESIEPNGHCSNFFIAAFCRKFFEECHPSNKKMKYL